MKKVLITGHKGFVGRHYLKYFKEKGIEVVGVDIKEGNDIKYYEINNELCTFSNSKQIDIKMLESKKPAMYFELFYVS